MILSVIAKDDYEFKKYDTTIDIDIESTSDEDIKNIFTTYITSPVKFIDNRSKKITLDFECANSIFLDFETKEKDGRSIVMTSLKEFMASDFYNFNKCIIITSKSHGSTGDCYHVIVILSDIIHSYSDYTTTVNKMRSELESEGIITDLGFTYPTFSKSPIDCEFYISDGFEYNPIKNSSKEVVELSDIDAKFNNHCKTNIDSVKEKIKGLCYDIGIIQSTPNNNIRKMTRYKFGFAKLGFIEWKKALNAIKSVYGDSSEGFGLVKLISSEYIKDDGSKDSLKFIYHTYRNCDGKTSFYNFFDVAIALVKRSKNFRHIYKIQNIIIELTNGLMDNSIDSYITGYQKIKRGRVMKSNNLEPKSIVDVCKVISSDNSIRKDQSKILLNSYVNTIDPLAYKNKVIEICLERIAIIVSENGKIQSSTIKLIRNDIFSEMGIVDGLLDKHVKIKDIKNILVNNGYKKIVVDGVRYYRKSISPVKSQEVVESIDITTEPIIEPTKPMNKYYGDVKDAYMDDSIEGVLISDIDNQVIAIADKTPVYITYDLRRIKKDMWGNVIRDYHIPDQKISHYEYNVHKFPRTYNCIPFEKVEAELDRIKKFELLYATN